MKVEIDLNDILGDEEGCETLADSVRRQVIESVKMQIRADTQKKIDEAVSATISAEIGKFVQKEMPVLLANIIDTEFVPVTRWGEKAVPTSFRKELLKTVHENMTYKKANYDSDKNAFTRAVDALVANHMTEFKTSFHKKVDADFTAAAMEYASGVLKKKLGVA